jgi:hypothetical protein
MRRYNSPFNGNRYVLNRNTGEIHDLDNESILCRIDELKPDHVLNCTSYEDAYIRAVLLRCPNPNGCHHCLPSKDNG